jgi:hypothetical protein
MSDDWKVVWITLGAFFLAVVVPLSMAWLQDRRFRKWRKGCSQRVGK